MNKIEKLKLKREWRIAGYRVFFYGTFLDALKYRNKLRNYYGKRITDLHYKPILQG